MTINLTWENYLGQGPHCETVYSLEGEIIDAIVPANVPNGNYKLFQQNPIDKKYYVVYVGRVADRISDEGLRDRLKEHIGEWLGIMYFDFEVKDTPLQAYYQECLDYHNWQPMYNSVHPAKLPGRNDECPICGE